MFNRTLKSGVELGIKLYGNALIHRSRNLALAHVAPDADYVLFVDDDMVPEPGALLALLAHGLPVVTALCTTRIEPVVFAVKAYNEKVDAYLPIDDVRPGALLKGRFAPGAAFLLVQRDVIDRLREHHLSARDWLADNRRLFDRLGVPEKVREKERARIEQKRRALWESEKLARIFDYVTLDDQMQLGEDLTFARRLHQIGVEVAVDGAVVVGHLGERAYGPWDVEAEQK